MRALLLERKKLVSRRVVRFLTCAGFETAVVDDPAQVREHLDGVALFVADGFDGDLVVEAVRTTPSLRGMLFTAEPVKPSLRHVVDNPQISNILGRKDFESAPHAWEVVMVARRLLQPELPAPTFERFLDWGFSGFHESVEGTAHRDELVKKVQSFVSHLGVPKRISELFGELSHEMLMNAIYDAPADAAGNAKYALDRKAVFTLLEAERPVLRIASDGTRVALQVTDPFGRLQRKHVFAGLARGLIDGGEMDRSHGGAGLGMVVCHNATIAMFFDVVRGTKTEVTGLFELDQNLREFRSHAKSLHFFER